MVKKPDSYGSLEHFLVSKSYHGSNVSKNLLGRSPSNFRDRCRTLGCSMAAAIGSIGLGSVIGYTSPAIPDLNSRSNSPYRLVSIEIAMVASIISIGGLIGEPIGGYVLDKIGRKMTLILSAFPFVIGWLLIAASTNVAMMYVGRFITGFCSGIMDVAVPVYIAEISEPSTRGFMGSCHELSTNFGLLFVFAFGCILPWNWLAVACAIIPVCMLVAVLVIPESPRWLLVKNRRIEALEALTWLRNESSYVSEEIADIDDNIKLSGTKIGLKDVTDPSIYKPFLIVAGLLFFQQFSGYGVIPEFMVSIFEAANSGWDPYIQTAIVGVFGVVANLLSAFAADKAGRRPMLILSACIMLISMSGLTAFFMVQHFGNTEHIFWLPTISLVMYNFGVALGYGPIPFYLASELFPLRARGLAGGMGIATVWLFMFITNMTYPGAIELLEHYGVYAILCGFCFMAVLFPILFVIETKGKTLEQIERDFKK
ncbi:Facilitated trehalose transporter Tret1 [Chamberlinius hualienensis]